MQHSTRKLFFLSLTGAIIAGAAFLPFASHAAGLLPDCVGASSSNPDVPGLSCALETMIGIGKYLFGIMGSAALFMFVAGGFFIVAAGGRDAWVKKGKEYVKNAIIGIAIILLAGYAIQYGVNSLRGGAEGTQCTGEYYTSDAQGTQTCCEAGNVVTIKKEGGKAIFTCEHGTAPAQ